MLGAENKRRKYKQTKLRFVVAVKMCSVNSPELLKCLELIKILLCF